MTDEQNKFWEMACRSQLIEKINKTKFFKNFVDPSLDYTVVSISNDIDLFEYFVLRNLTNNIGRKQ